MSSLVWTVQRLDRDDYGGWRTEGTRKTLRGAQALLARLCDKPVYGYQRTGEAYGEPVLEVHGFRISYGWG